MRKLLHLSARLGVVSDYVAKVANLQIGESTIHPEKSFFPDRFARKEKWDK
ncbi:MAG: hypothetical protein JSS82_13550 [Bacteroidetes bacterium]|nr:hypothetical protein [Bacteroidota bacterium]